MSWILSLFLLFLCPLPVFPHLFPISPFHFALLLHLSPALPPTNFSPTVKTSAEEDTRAAGRPRHHASWVTPSNTELPHKQAHTQTDTLSHMLLSCSVTQADKWKEWEKHDEQGNTLIQLDIRFTGSVHWKNKKKIGKRGIFKLPHCI